MTTGVQIHIYGRLNEKVEFTEYYLIMPMAILCKIYKYCAFIERLCG